MSQGCRRKAREGTQSVAQVSVDDSRPQGLDKFYNGNVRNDESTETPEHNLALRQEWKFAEVESYFKR
jgi:hypothetical protein